MEIDKFKMPQSSYNELTKIIKAYGHIDQAASLDDVSKFVGLHTTIISRNAGFLTSCGIIDPGQKKIATPLGRNLAHALEHDVAEDIKLWWRKVINQSDFLTKLITAIKIRNGMETETLEAHIAYSAGQPKKPQYMTGARTIIDILLAAEVVMEDNNKIIFLESATEAVHDSNTESAEQSNGALAGPLSKVYISTPKSTTSIVLNINITCNASEIEGLGEKIKQLISQVESN